MRTVPAELVNPLGLTCFATVCGGPRIGVALPKRAAVCVLKSAGRGCYFNTSPDNETLALIDFATHQPIYVKISADFPFVSHLSVSHDGLYLAVSFEFGTIDIHQIVYDRCAPAEIHRFASFSERAKCSGSVILSPDFICASAFHPKIVLWNIATQLRHREISTDFASFQLHFDPFAAVLSVFGARDVAQYSVNGQLLHAVAVTAKVSAVAFMPIDFAFDKRVFVLGHFDGSVSFIAVDSTDYKLKVIARRQLHTSKVVSLFVDELSLRLTSCDDRGIVFQSEFDILDPASVVNRCHFCGNPQTDICSRCQTPICDYCANDANDLCPNCTASSSRLSFLAT
jgi:hypothetical protein